MPDLLHKRYDINIRTCETEEELTFATKGTIRSEGKGQKSFISKPI